MTCLVLSDDDAQRAFEQMGFTPKVTRFGRHSGLGAREGMKGRIAASDHVEAVGELQGPAVEP